MREAAADLGAGRSRPSLDPALPLSAPGVLAGALLMFIPAVGEFVIPDLLGGSDTMMIGRVMWNDFFREPRLARRRRPARSSCLFFWSDRSSVRASAGERGGGGLNSWRASRLRDSRQTLGFLFLTAQRRHDHRRPLVRLQLPRASRLVTVQRADFRRRRWYASLFSNEQLLGVGDQWRSPRYRR